MAPSVALARITSHLEDFDGAFLRCTDCTAVHRISHTDRAMSYHRDGSEAATDDLQRFLSAHLNHRFQLLRRSSEAETYSHARWDPMCRVAWEVSDGEDEFVVWFGRTDLDRPREYVILPGRMRLESESVVLDCDTLGRVIDEALYPFAAPHSKVEGVVDRCRRLVGDCPADRLEPIDELRDDPNVQLACLPATVAAALRRDLTQIFQGGALLETLDSVLEDLQLHIPIIRLTRRYRIESHG